MQKFPITDQQQITYFSFSKNQELYSSILSAAREADYPELSLFDQDQHLICRFDATFLFFAWIESLLGNLTVSLFSGKENEIFSSPKDEKLYNWYLQICNQLHWPDDLVLSNQDQFNSQKINQFSVLFTNFCELEKELLLLSFSDCPLLHKKIYRILAGKIDCFLQFTAYKFYTRLKYPGLRTIHFASAICDYILIDAEYLIFLERSETKLLDMLHEWYF